MRHTRYYSLFIYIAALLATACSDEVNLIGNWSPSLSPRQVEFSVGTLDTFAYEGGNQTLTITSNIEWKVFDKPDFVSITPVNGNAGTNTVTVTALPNDGNAVRSGDIVLGDANATGFRTKVYVEQGYAEITLNEQTITVASTAGSSHQLTLTANQKWTAAFQTGTWAHVTPESGDGTVTLILTADDNPSLNQREDVLTITPSVTNTPLTFRFIQQGKTLAVSTTEVSIDPKGGNSDLITITTDGTYSVTKSGDWFTVSQSGNTVTAKASANTTDNVRTGSITVSMTNLPSGESLTRVITVRQKSPNTIEGGGYTDDKNWDFDKGGSAGDINGEGFTDDKNWDF